METTEKTKRIPEDKKETPEDKFEIKAYLKTEFAQLYFPLPLGRSCTEKTAEVDRRQSRTAPPALRRP